MNDKTDDESQDAARRKERRLEPLADDFADWETAAEDEYTDEFDEFDEFEDIEAFEEETTAYATPATGGGSNRYDVDEDTRDAEGDALSADASDYAQVEEDEWEETGEPEPPGIPWGLVAAGIVAIILVAAGGYGVMQDRAAMQEEIRRLQASLATATAPEETQASRASLRELEQVNSDLRSTIDILETENRGLRETVTGLEGQLATLLSNAGDSSPGPGETSTAVTQTAPTPAPAAQKATPQPAASAPTAQKTTPPPAATAPAAGKTPTTPAATTPTAGKTPPTPAATTPGGEWFVNFGSYSREDIAREWAGRLRVDSGAVVVTTAQRNGATLYRVRVTGLVSREQAQGVARALEQRYDLERLWVGRE